MSTSSNRNCRASSASFGFSPEKKRRCCGEYLDQCTYTPYIVKERSFQAFSFFGHTSDFLYAKQRFGWSFFWVSLDLARQDWVDEPLRINLLQDFAQGSTDRLHLVRQRRRRAVTSGGIHGRVDGGGTIFFSTKEIKEEVTLKKNPAPSITTA